MRRPKDTHGSSRELISAEVIERCKKGDQTAWRQLVDSTQGDVYTLCLRILRNPDDAAEATQDTYYKVFKGLRSFRGEALFTTWLYRVATNAALSRQRARARQRERETQGDEVLAQIAAPGSIERQAESRLDLRSVDSALAKLPDHYRTTVVLRDVYGLTIQEIAKRQKISETAAKVRVHRARKRLKELVFDHPEESERTS